MRQRIGDAERDRAADLLRDNFAEGRLDQAEFDERIGRALTAKTQADLDPLFVDLPGPRPSGAPATTGAYRPPPWQQPAQAMDVRPAAPPPVANRFNTAWGVASAFAWPIAIIACFATDWRYWWIMMIPVFFPWWVGSNRRDGSRRR